MSAPQPTTWYRFCRAVVRYVCFPIIGGLRHFHRQNEPLDGPVIIAPAHFSVLDPPLISTILKRPLTFMAKEELFAPFLFGPLIRSLGAFPIRRGASDTEAIKLALQLLSENRLVLLFPEGTRGKGEQLGPMRAGVMLLAKKSGARVLPIGINGTHIVFPKGAKKIRRHRMQVALGESFTYQEVTEGLPDKEARARFQDELETRLQRACLAAGLTIKTASKENPTESIPDSAPQPAPEIPSEEAQSQSHS